MNDQPVAIANPFVDPQTCFIVVPMHLRGVGSAHGSMVTWDGPYRTKEDAQKAAARWMMQSNFATVSVFQLVGTVARPAPDLSWHEPTSTEST